MKLKIKVVDADKTHVMIQIVEQEGFKYNEGLAFNGILFKSMVVPEYRSSDFTFFVKGTSPMSNDNVVHIPLENWPQVFNAIERLNVYVEPKHTIVIDGKTIEISEESFNALKESLTK